MVPARARLAVIACVALAAAACGTTVQGAGTLADSSGLGAPAPTDTSATPTAGTPLGTASGQSVGTTTGGLSGATGSTGSTVGGSTGTDIGTGGTTGTTGGVVAKADRTPIKIGALYLDGGNAVLAAGFAATPVNFGDGQLEAKAVVADINAHGGVGGRPIQLFLQKIAATDTGKPAAFDAACTALAEDQHVFAIMSIFNLRTSLAACAAKHKTLLLDAALGAEDDAGYRQYGDWAFTPSEMSLDTEQKLVIHNAFATGVISPKTRVGVIVQNDDDIFPRVLKNTIEPTLKALGVPFESVIISNATDSSGISNAILKFSQDNVSVVQFSAGNGGVPEVVFMQAADQQQFHPTYIMGDSTNTWFTGDSAPEGQAAKITGVGSYPIANVDANQVPSTPGEKHCLDVISKAGESVTDRHTSLTATFYCEMLYGFAAAGARVQGPMTSADWRSAYRGLGTTYPTIMSFAVDVQRSPNAGAQVYRSLAWNAACTCVAYTSGLKHL